MRLAHAVRKMPRSVVFLLSLLAALCLVGVANSQPVKLDVAVAGDASIDASYMTSVTHEELAAAVTREEEEAIALAAHAAATAAAAAAAAAAVAPGPFLVTDYTDGPTALRAYADWHNRTMASEEACTKADVLVWRAAAGWGDSVNAATSSFRNAMASGRLFFIIWASRNDAAMWRRGLVQPDFLWDWEEAFASHATRCKFDRDALRSPRAARRDNNPPARFVTISGSMVSDHPLAGLMDRFYSGQVRSAITSLGDRLLQEFLLRPNPVLEDWIERTHQALLAGRPADFGGVVGMQVRTGYADAPSAAHRPSNANFLATGDERLFLEKFESLFAARPFESKPDRALVFLMTDSPDVRKWLTSELQTRLGVTVVTVADGEVAHCGPSQSVTTGGVLRMLAEWFVFRRHTDVQIITAWSLFGGTAVEGKNENKVHRIDASNCGKQKGAKSCQMR